MKRILLILLIFVLLGIPLFGVYLGLFSPVDVDVKQMGPYYVLYMDQTGDYSQTGQTIRTVEEKSKAIGIESLAGAGIFYDNPKEVPTEKLRSDAGILIREQDIGNIPPLINEHIKYKRIEKQRFLMARFPYRNKLSYLIGPMRVYPRLNERIKDKKLLSEYSMEIYEPEKITFLIPYKKEIQ